MDKRRYELLYSDTDSYYVNLGDGALNLDDLVTERKRKKFYRHRHEWLPSESCDLHRREYVKLRTIRAPWVQPECCGVQERLDQRKPGLFKKEFSGTAFVGLNSKTYYCVGDQDDKFSCKGLQKSTNQLTFDQYARVLQTGHSDGGENRGFRSFQGHVYTYEQKRQALSYLYCKRVVCSDGINTTPVLC